MISLLLKEKFYFIPDLQQVPYSKLLGKYLMENLVVKRDTQ